MGTERTKFGGLYSLSSPLITVGERWTNETLKSRRHCTWKKGKRLHGLIVVFIVVFIVSIVISSFLSFVLSISSRRLCRIFCVVLPRKPGNSLLMMSLAVWNLLPRNQTLRFRTRNLSPACRSYSRIAGGKIWSTTCCFIFNFNVANWQKQNRKCLIGSRFQRPCEW